jgi:Flp pilus assembly protein TadD
MSFYIKIFKVACLIGTVAVAACQTETVDKDDILLKSLYETAAKAEITGDHSAAVSHYQNLFQRNPDDPQLRLSLARNLRYSGLAARAVQLLEAAEPEHLELVDLQIELGKSKLAAGKTRQAIGILLKVAEKDQENWEIFSALGIAYDLVENFEAARAAYERAMGLSEENPAVLNNMALSIASSGDLDGAIELLKNAPRLARHNPHIRQNLAMLFGIKGDKDSAQALSRMDLDEETVQQNLKIYTQLGQK